MHSIFLQSSFINRPFYTKFTVQLFKDDSIEVLDEWSSKCLSSWDSKSWSTAARTLLDSAAYFSHRKSYCYLVSKVRSTYLIIVEVCVSSRWSLPEGARLCALLATMYCNRIRRKVEIAHLGYDVTVCYDCVRYSTA